MITESGGERPAILASRHIFYFLFVIASLVPFRVPLNGWFLLAFDDHRYSHVLVIPFVTLCLVYLNRAAIFLEPRYAVVAGTSVLLAGSLFYGVASFAWIDHGWILFALIIAIVSVWIGGFILCYGTRACKSAAFPLLVLLLMVPMPTGLLDSITRVLQMGSAEITYLLFTLAKVPVFRDGYTFNLPGVTIEVAEQCSSIRSSTALFITSILVGYFFLRSGWTRVCVSLLTLPIAMFTNAVRIVAISSLAVYVNLDFLEGKLHRQGGALFSLISVGILMSMVFVLQRSRACWQAEGGAGRVSQERM